LQEDDLTSMNPDILTRRHIAKIDFPAFYVDVFPSLDSARTFYSQLDALPPEQNKGKIVFHQTARMIWLADQIDEVARGRPAFQVLFYLIAAELVAKLTFDFEREGESKKYVRRFFAEICDDDTRNRLGGSFGLTWDEVVNLLYRVRCDVVHEGMYYGFQLRLEQDDFAQFVHVTDVSYTTTLTVQELRRMVLKGALSASRRLLESAKQSATAASHQP